MNIKPGDLFEWAYKHNKRSVFKHEQLHSSYMGKWVPCDGLCLCVAINDTIYWISNEGIFYAWIKDEISRLAQLPNTTTRRIFPRKLA